MSEKAKINGRKRAAEVEVDQSVAPNPKLSNSASPAPIQLWERRKWYLPPIKKVKRTKGGKHTSVDGQYLNIKLYTPEQPDDGHSCRSVRFGYICEPCPTGRAFVTTHWTYEETENLIREKELFTLLEQRFLDKMVCFHVPTIIENMHGLNSTDLELTAGFCGRSLEKSIEALVVRTGFDYLSIFIQLAWFMFCILDSNPTQESSTPDFSGLRFSLQLAPCNGYFLFKYILPMSSQESRVLSLTTRIKVTITALPNFKAPFSPSPSTTSLSASDISSTPPLAMSSSSVPQSSRASRTRSFNSRREAHANDYNIINEALHPEGTMRTVIMPMIPDTLSIHAVEDGITSQHLLSDLFRTSAKSKAALGRASWLELADLASNCYCPEDERQFAEFQILGRSPPRMQDTDPLILQQREQWISELEAPLLQRQGINEDANELVKPEQTKRVGVSSDVVSNPISLWRDHPASAIEAFLVPIGAPMDETEEGNKGKVICAPNLPFALPCDSSLLYVAPSAIFESSTSPTMDGDTEEGAKAFTGGIGLGIFAAKFIPAKTILSAYCGQIVTSNVVNRSKGNFFNTHLVTASYSMGTQYDGLRYPRAGKGVASLVNSTTDTDGRKTRPYNATFQDIKPDSLHDIMRIKVISAARDIQPDEEILIQYIWI